METNETCLAKPTDLDEKVSALLAREKITPGDIDNLDNYERRHLEGVVNKMLQGLKDNERDNFINKMELITSPLAKSDIWECNHYNIVAAISNLMQQDGAMPTTSELAAATGLSRQTITKHLKEYETKPEYKLEIGQFKFMTSKLMAQIFNSAVNGDIKASRLYFEMVGAISKRQHGTVVNEQKNYIQINNTVLSQENLKRLTAEQLNQIESMIMKMITAPTTLS